MAIPSIIHEYAGVKMGNMLMDLVTDLNPIQLSKAANAQSEPDIGGNIKAIRKLVKQGSGEPNKGMTLSEYFSGKKIGATHHGDSIQFHKRQNQNRFIDEKQDSVRASTRSIAAGAVAAYGASPLILGEDNPINRTIEAGAAFGMHAGITAAAIRRGGGAAMFGVGYGGLAAINAVRSGNNFGPF